MAAVAVPLIEVAVSRVLIALGVGVVAGAANEAAKERARAQSDAGAKAQASPIARADACVQTSGGATAKSGVDRDPCKLCPPDGGAQVTRRWHMSPHSREYQARVTGFPPYTEWAWMGVDFDGFTSGECHLKEAKGHYAQFLLSNDDGELEAKWFFTAFHKKWLEQAEAQAAATTASAPARLTWFIEEMDVYAYTAAKLMRYPPLVAVWFP